MNVVSFQHITNYFWHYNVLKLKDRITCGENWQIRSILVASHSKVGTLSIGWQNQSINNRYRAGINQNGGHSFVFTNFWEALEILLYMTNILIKILFFSRMNQEKRSRLVKRPLANHNSLYSQFMLPKTIIPFIQISIVQILFTGQSLLVS